MQIRKFDNGSVIVADEIQVGENVSIGAGTSIRTARCIIGDDVSIGRNNQFLVSQGVGIGPNTIIGHANDVKGRSVTIGAYNYWESNIEVGQGGGTGPNSHLVIGSYSMVCDRVILNLNDRIDIGTYVGIGNEVNIWTHGSFLPVLEGFPSDFGPVSIGDKVWLPARSVVLPNCRIGDNIVIGIGSLINQDIPDGAFAAGWPVRIVERDRFPNVDTGRNRELIRAILADYDELRSFKQLDLEITYDENQNVIRSDDAIFRLDQMVVQGTLTTAQEDFRDYLRRRGIKFYTGRPFVSQYAHEFQRLIDVEID